MKILAIDTSSEYLSLAVIDEDKMLCEINRKLEKLNHCRYLIPYLKDMLNKNKIKLKDLDVLCVGLGPGSFTGLRVGMASAKGLNLVCNKKLIGISSMDAIAYNIDKKDKIIVCIKDAKKHKVYGCLYRKTEDGGLEKLTDYLLLEFDRLISLVKKISKKEKKKVIFTADGVDCFKEDILKIINDAVFSPKSKWPPRALYLAEEALRILKKNKDLNSLYKIEPLYLHSQYANITKPKGL